MTERDMTRGVLRSSYRRSDRSSIWILRPFLGAIVWADDDRRSQWPLMIAAAIVGSGASAHWP